nr:putative mfs-type transporter [Quercus suber]
MFSAALSLGDTAPQGWRTGYVLALLIVGILLLIIFVVWDCFYKYPLVSMSIWRDRNFSLVLLVLLLGYMAFSPASFFTALYFQNVWHFSALSTAVHLLPMVINGLFVNIVAGLVLHRISNKLLMYIGAAAYAIAFLLSALNTRSSSYWAFFFPSLTLAVVGADLEFNVANMYVMSSMPPSQQSIAGSIFQTVSKLCQTFGFGITTAVFNAVRQSPDLAPYWDPESQPYAATFWFSTASALLGLCLVPFLTIGTQGGRETDEHAVMVGEDEEIEPRDGAEKAQAEANVAQALPVEG